MRRARVWLWLAGLALPVALGLWAVDRRLEALAGAMGLEALAQVTDPADCLA
jgi:hypothetical protein